MLQFLTAAILLASALLTAAHPGEEEHGVSALEKQQHAKRAATASKCSQHLEARRRQRRAKRSLGVEKRAIPSSSLTTADFGGNATIQNSTCILAPEVTEGPYYINNELVRQDMRENQSGIDLILDIGVMDINTCEPIENVYVEIWACNATGHYSGFTSNNGGGGGSAPSGNSTMTKRQGMSSSTSDDYSFGRGGWPTNAEGVAELITTMPGFYTGRTVHTHVMLHNNYSISDDGSLISSSGTLMHVGQIFYEEDLLTQVLATSAYTNTTETRTLNADDTILSSAVGTAMAETSLIGDSIEDGIFAYITIGVDTSADYSISSVATATAIDSSIASSARHAATAGVLAAESSSSGSSTSIRSSSSSGTSTSATTTGTAASNAASSSSSASFANRIGGNLVAAAAPVFGALAFI